MGTGISGILDVSEWVVLVIREMYKDATTTVRLNGRESEAFSVKVVVHQGSVLSQLLFIIVWRLCLESSGEDCPWNCFMPMISF